MTAVVEPPASVRFQLPAELSAAEPPELRGVPRDSVRLLVADGHGVQHARFHELPRFLQAGDLLVVNTSGTLAAAVDGLRMDGRATTVHFSARHGPVSWTLELRRPDGTGPQLDGAPGERIALPGGGAAVLRTPVDGRRPRLWRAAVEVGGPVRAYLARHGRPITYGYLHGRFGLDRYQTVFATEPGSAEMASAARPFTPELVTRLVCAGVLVAPVTLHCGVSSLEAQEPPQPERFAVPPPTAALVQHTRRHGGRVVAVGTSATRALETVAGADGSVRAGGGWTDLVLGPDRPARVVDGLVTGWHAPGASHLWLLEAVAGGDLVRTAYDAALAERYLWHEFGDSCLLLPGRRRA